MSSPRIAIGIGIGIGIIKQKHQHNNKSISIITKAAQTQKMTIPHHFLPT
jgi:hypothetical protein